MTERAPHVEDSELSVQVLRLDNAFLREMIKDLQRQLEESNAINRSIGEQLDRLYGLLESQQTQMFDMRE